MDGPNQVSTQAYLAAMAQRMEQTLKRVAQAVNDAPDGAWINASEMIVFNEFNDLRREAYEKASWRVPLHADAGRCRGIGFFPRSIHPAANVWPARALGIAAPHGQRPGESVPPALCPRANAHRPLGG
jgi:hypothetical protein